MRAPTSSPTILSGIASTARDRFLDVIQQDSPDSYRHLDTIHTHYGAHTLGIDPATHRLYVGYAGLLAAPRLAVFTPQLP